MSRFLIWCTGARQDYVEPGMERHRYVTMGLSLVVTALLAAGSMLVLTGYLLEDVPLAVRVAVAAFWAFTVFTIDRTIAVTLVDRESFWAHVGVFLPRVLLAAAAAYLVSEPLVLRVFEKEISEQRTQDAEALRQQIRTEVDQRPDIRDRQAVVRTPVTDADNEIVALREKAAQADAAARREEAGLGETGKPKCGPVCRKFRGEREAALADIAAVQARLPAAEAEVARRQVELDTLKDGLVFSRVEEFRRNDGFVARHEALRKYLSGSPTAQLLRWSLTAVLFLVDLLVLMFKVLGSETLHDRRTKTDRMIVRNRLNSRLIVSEERSLADAREDAQPEAEFLAEQAERARDATRALWAAEDARPRRSWKRLASRLLDTLWSRLAPRSVSETAAEPGDATPGATPSPRGRRWQRQPAEGDVVAGRYQLLEEIGRGGYGTVYRAEDKTNGVEVAVKIMPASLTDNWWRDVRNVPGGCRFVANVLEAGGYGRRWRFVVYPVYRPGSLEKVCASIKATRSAWWCLSVIEQTLYALGAGHSDPRYLVHRDVKPGNILLDGDEVRLADWGRARNSRDDSPQVALGTWRWTAPEVFDGRGRTDVSDGLSDLWSVGAVAYWLLTGRPPLAREMSELYLNLDNDGRVLAERRGLVPRRLDEIDPRIPAEIAHLVQSWLSPRPRDRADDKRHDLACLYALSLLRVAMQQHGPLLHELVVPLTEPSPREASGGPPPGGLWPGQESESTGVTNGNRSVNGSSVGPSPRRGVADLETHSNQGHVGDGASPRQGAPPPHAVDPEDDNTPPQVDDDMTPMQDDASGQTGRPQS